MLGKSISVNSLILTIFALVTAGVLALTANLTAERIEQEERKAAQRALLEIVPESLHDNDMLEDLWPIPNSDLKQLNLPDGASAHLAKSNGQVIGVIFPTVAPEGYSGAIKLIVGVFTDGRVAGVRVLSHKETPGLGDKIDLNKSDWVLRFNDTSLNSPKAKNWKVKKDGGEFDQFTGATITPRAVVKQVKAVLDFYQAQSKSILSDQTKEPNLSNTP